MDSPCSMIFSHLLNIFSSLDQFPVVWPASEIKSKGSKDLSRLTKSFSTLSKR